MTSNREDAAKATNKAGAATKQAAFSTPKDAKKK
jgi:hypothetical protein